MSAEDAITQAGDRQDTTDKRPRKRRKPRIRLNCEECRRLKIKCDRGGESDCCRINHRLRSSDPCGNCIRRGTVDICNGSADHHEATLLSAPKSSNRNDGIEDRITVLERFIVSNNLSVPEPIPDGSQHKSNLGMDNAPPDPWNVILTHNVAPTNSSPPTTSLHVAAPSGRPILNAMPREPIQPLQPQPNTVTNVPSVEATDPSPIWTGQADEDSHGTLVVSASGRSRYLGRGAGSEWLKEVGVCLVVLMTSLKHSRVRKLRSGLLGRLPRSHRRPSA